MRALKYMEIKTRRIQENDAQKKTNKEKKTTKKTDSTN